MQIPTEMSVNDPRVGGPRSECSGGFSKHHAAEAEDSGYKRPCPSASEVGELRQRLCENELVRVPLKVAEDRGSEDRCHHDHAEKAEDGVQDRGGERAVQQHLVVDDVEEVLRRHGKEGQVKPKGEEDVGRNAPQAELQLERKEFPEQCHIDPN